MMIIPNQRNSVSARLLLFVDHADLNPTKMAPNLDIEELTVLRNEKVTAQCKLKKYDAEA